MLAHIEQVVQLECARRNRNENAPCLLHPHSPGGIQSRDQGGTSAGGMSWAHGGHRLAPCPLFRNGDAQSWLTLQIAYDLRIVELASGEAIARQVKPREAA